MPITQSCAIVAIRWSPMAEPRRYRLWGLALMLLVLALDRLSKEALIDRLDGQDPITVTGFFNLVMVWNRGVSFGLFQQDQTTGRLVLAGFAVLVALGLAIWLWRAAAPLLAAGLGLVIGGALGNAYDRLIYGAVADFFDAHLMGVHFWAFNIADAAITFGVICLMADAVFFSGRPMPAATKEN